MGGSSALISLQVIKGQGFILEASRKSLSNIDSKLESMDTLYIGLSCEVKTISHSQ